MSVMSNVSERGFGLAEAARVCGVSKPTVRRRKNALVRAGAIADDMGWDIPAAALVAVGLLAQAPGPATRALSPVTALPVRRGDSAETASTGSLAGAAAHGRIAELEAELSRVRQELAAARARAEERDRCLRVLETALAALGADQSMTTPEVTPGPAVTPPPASAGPRAPTTDGWRSPATWTHPTGP